MPRYAPVPWRVLSHTHVTAPMPSVQPPRAAIVHCEPDGQPQIYGADVVIEADAGPINTGLLNSTGQLIWRWPDAKVFGFIGKK